MVQSTGARDSAWWAAYWTNFLGEAPPWYKCTIVGFLLVNPFLYLFFGGIVAGWVLVLQFIFTLAMALKCYPLQPGGLLALEALFMGLTTTGIKDETGHLVGGVAYEVLHNWQVILLLVFMVAGIYFMKELLLFTFTKLLVKLRNKALLSVMFCFVAAILSAFLDALTVTAVVISVAVGFYGVYH
ncbi:MAG: sodium/proton antiporter, partial [Gammaproteobacteria bacterium]|nr:sodium/proton antiporter [Gammaproteobacteria bacterium]